MLQFSPGFRSVKRLPLGVALLATVGMLTSVPVAASEPGGFPLEGSASASVGIEGKSLDEESLRKLRGQHAEPGSMEGSDESVAVILWDEGHSGSGNGSASRNQSTGQSNQQRQSITTHTNR